MRIKSFLKAGLAAAALMAVAPAAYAADDGVNVGTLECRVQEGWGHVIASSRDMNCVFRPVDGGPEQYTGELSRYGVDLGYTSDATLIWAVFAPSSDMARGALEGDYGGASAQATVGVGLGANVLVGGFDRSIALQPLSVEGNTGLAVAAGVGVITLRQA
jgi:ABC-type sugar transport system substrate-binding protein